MQKTSATKQEEKHVTVVALQGFPKYLGLHRKSSRQQTQACSMR